MGFSLDLNKQQEEEGIVCGTPGYFAPELLNGYKLTTKSDIFSLGCLLFKLISGKSLFNGADKKRVLLANKKSEFIPSFKDDIRNCSSELKDLLRLLLTTDPEIRPTAAQALSQ